VASERVTGVYSECIVIGAEAGTWVKQGLLNVFLEIEKKMLFWR
jgi:hypothetical protein